MGQRRYLSRATRAVKSGSEPGKAKHGEVCAHQRPRRKNRRATSPWHFPSTSPETPPFRRIRSFRLFYLRDCRDGRACFATSAPGAGSEAGRTPASPPRAALAALAVLVACLAAPIAWADEAWAQQRPAPEAARLIEQVRDKDPAFSRAAAQALGRLGPEAQAAAVPSLIEMVRDDDAYVRTAAARALGELGAAAQAAAVPALQAILAQTDGRLRQAAMLALAEIEAAQEARRSLVRLEEGRLTVRASAARLGRLLDEISRQAKIAVELGEGVGSERVSVEFADLPLDAGLRRILAEHDAFYYHRGGKGLLTVWVYAKHRGRGLYPVPPDEWASTAELERGLTDADPAERAWALATLAQRKGELAREQVTKGLDDGDQRVRTAALYQALNEGIELPPEKLAELAVSDPSYKVRFLALEGLAGEPSLEWIAEQALDDPNPAIRSYAESILDRLERANRPARASQPAQAGSQGQ